MKHLTAALLTLAPASAFAHGAHPPVPEAAHGAAHGWVPLMILAALGLVVALWVGRKNDER